MVEAHPTPNNPRFKDLTGRKFGRLTITAYAGKNIRGSLWICKCDCGTPYRIVEGCKLTIGHTKSCGCLRIALLTTHMQTHTPEYRVWSNMLHRCRDKNYKNYAGRGITFCKRWEQFQNFLSDMGARPSPNHSIDRINNDLGYCKDNCQWATSKEQTRNRRITKHITLDGVTRCLNEWSEISGIKARVIANRIRKGRTIANAIFDPTRKSR